jgi:putative tricarboxylic transport membrane protein
VIQRLMRDSDILAGSLLAALGVFIITEANRWEYMGFDGPGPGFFPLWYGIVITVLSLWLVLGRARALRSTTTGTVGWASVRRALGTWAAFVVSIALMQPLGFVLSFALLTLVMVRLQFGQPWRTAVLSALGLAAGFHILFPLALDVPLPTGWLGF